MSMTKKDYILIAGVLKEVGEFAQIPTADKKYNNGKYKVAIKVVDIFGNDTTRVIEVDV